MLAVRDIDQEQSLADRAATEVAVARPRSAASEGRTGAPRPPGDAGLGGTGDAAAPPKALSWSEEAKDDLKSIAVELKEVEKAIRQLYEEQNSKLIITQATLAFLVVGVFFLLVVGLVPVVYEWVTSAFAICLVFSFMATASAAFICLIPGDGAWTIVALVTLVVVVTISNSYPFKFKFGSLESYYRPGSRAAIEPVLELPPEIDSRTNDDAALLAWSDAISKMDDAQQKLVVVAVSGGATRSAIWTALVLGEICKRIPGFARHIRIISGTRAGWSAPRTSSRR